MKESCCAIEVSSNITLYHRGPPLDMGPLPAFFYFALSGEDSLCKDPFNQPIQFLPTDRIRTFSMTLPGHENQLPPSKALHVWADDYLKNRDPVNTFLDALIQAIDAVIEQRFVDPNQLAVGGLSRGGFIALHAAARDERLKYVLAFAPVTDLSYVKEFHALKEDPRIQALHTSNLKEALIHRQIKLYMGNLDTRVNTQSCLDFAMDLVESAHDHQIRSPKLFLSLYPSIGHQGHGTPPAIFNEGAHWIAECLQR